MAAPKELKFEAKMYFVCVMQHADENGCTFSTFTGQLTSAVRFPLTSPTQFFLGDKTEKQIFF